MTEYALLKHLINCPGSWDGFDYITSSGVCVSYRVTPVMCVSAQLGTSTSRPSRIMYTQGRADAPEDTNSKVAELVMALQDKRREHFSPIAAQAKQTLMTEIAEISGFTG